jgi:hypothetical protein
VRRQRRQVTRDPGENAQGGLSASGSAIVGSGWDGCEEGVRLDASARAEVPAHGRLLRLRVDGRLVLVAALVAYGFALFSPHLTTATPNWTKMGVLDSTVPFADMREITSAWECVRKGESVIVHDYCDPVNWRPANFPQIWMRLTFLGLGQGATNGLGIAVDLIFLGSIFLLTGPLRWWEGAVYGALVTSPSIMLGVDRANVDLLLFAFVVVALLAFARAGPRVRVLGCALLELAAWLKLFPIFATGAVLRWRRRPALLAFAAITLVFLGYAVVIWHEIKTIRSVVESSIPLSFGAGVIVQAFPHYGGTNNMIGNRPLAILLLCLFTLAVAVGLALLLKRRQSDQQPEPSSRLLSLWAGAGIVIGCWAFTENSWDYRLAFCLLAVPQFLEWARQRNPVMPFAGWALALMVATLWLSDTQPMLWPVIDKPWGRAESVFPFDEVLVWGLVVYLAVAMLRTLPPWITQPEASLSMETATASATAAAIHALRAHPNGTAEESVEGDAAALALFEEATACYQNGDFERALARYEELLAAGPGSRDLECGARLNLGLALEKAGRRAEADAAYVAITEQFDPAESDYIGRCVRQARKHVRTPRVRRLITPFR